MHRNFATILSVSLLFGLGAGIYEFALPYFLDVSGVSVPRMGFIYAVGAILVFIVRIYAGHLSDIFGRKSLYSVSVALTAIVNTLTPATAAVWAQAVLKSTFDAGAMIFDSMYQLCLHDDNREFFLSRVGKVRGLQALAAAAGTMAAGLLLADGIYARPFHLAAASFLVGLIVFLIGYRPRTNAAPDGNTSRPSAHRSLRALFSLDLPRPLLILTVTTFIFTVGLSISHCFVMQLFWERQFGASTSIIGIILMLHRFTIAIPLLALQWKAKSHLKRIFIIFLTFEGLAIAASGFIGSLIPSAIVWLTHDLFGAGVWMPAQSALIQRYSRQATRGQDTTKVFAIGSLGWIFGPLIAGAIFDRWHAGPFILSGAIVIIAAAVLLLLPDDD
jgi:MFS family permease